MANYRKWQRVVRVLHGAGVKTASVSTVLSVRKGVVSLDTTDAIFDDETSQEIKPSFAGFSSEIIPLEA